MAKAAFGQLGNLSTAKHEFAQRLHALRRLYKRYGFVMSGWEYQEACVSIKEGKNPSIGPGRIGGTVHLVKCRGKELTAVWDDETKQIVTFLPKGNENRFV